MTEKENKRTLSFVQILAGAGSAVTAAYIGTKLGVSGTIIGAAVGSITGTVASHLYANSLSQGKEALKKAQDIALVSSLSGRKNTTVVTTNDSPEKSGIDDTLTETVTSDGIIVTSAIAQGIIADDLADLERSIRTPWYKTVVLRQVTASATVALIVALGFLYFNGALNQGGTPPDLQGGVSINSIVVETEMPSSEPTIIYMTPEPSEAPERPLQEPEIELPLDGNPNTEPTTPPEGSEHPSPTPKPQQPVPAPKPTPTPAPQPPATQKPTPTPAPTPEPTLPTAPDSESASGALIEDNHNKDTIEISRL